MDPSLSYPRLVLPAGEEGEYALAYMQMKGFLGVGIVETEDGQHYAVFFATPWRITQELSASASRATGAKPCFVEHGLIVIPEVTVESMEAALKYAWEDGFFDGLKPIDRAVPRETIQS